MDKLDNMHKKAMTQAERSSNYKKRQNIQRIVIDLKPEDYNIISNYCKNNNISKTSFIVKSCKYIIDNNIQFKE